MCGFIAQLVEHRTGIAEVTGSNPVEALIFFRLLLSNCLSWKINCEDHPSLSSATLKHISIPKAKQPGYASQSFLSLRFALVLPVILILSASSKFQTPCYQTDLCFP